MNYQSRIQNQKNGEACDLYIHTPSTLGTLVRIPLMSVEVTMRKMGLRLTTICLLLLPSGLVFSETGEAPETPKLAMELIEVSPSVVMLLNDHGANITCIALDSGLVFVDAGLSTAIAADFRRAMEARFERTAVALALTHGHLDHIFGMGAFSDVQVVAAKSGKPLIERQLAIDWSAEAIEVYTGIFPTFAEDVQTAQPFLPTLWVADSLSLDEGKQTAVFRVNGGHTSDSSNIYFPSEGVLVAGDLVQVDKYPYFGDSTNDLDQWIETLAFWSSLPLSKICPGHGRVVARDYLQPIQLYFESLKSVLADLENSGLPVEEVVVHPNLPQGYWPEQQEPRWWKMCIARAYSKAGT